MTLPGEALHFSSRRKLFSAATWLAALAVFLAGGFPFPPGQAAASDERADSSLIIDWPHYGRDPGGTRYSPAAQITPGNVQHLQVAWVYRTGDWLVGPDGSRFETTPLFVDGTVYLSTPFGRVIALDPERGRERWTFDPQVDLEGDYGDFANRGVATWLDPKKRSGESCRRRIFVAPIDARLIALDAATGEPCREFGREGTIDLNRDLLNPPAWKGEYQVTSPPTVVKNLVIVGSAIADNQRAEAPSGLVRAFDTRTGKLRWAWDPIPREAKLRGYETWKSPSRLRTGAANAWSVFSADPERDLLFVPVGSAAPDFYGGERLGQNLYSSSLVALRASTGKIVWYFQAVHHDIWDYDVPSQPVLTTVRRAGLEVPAVVQGTKMGHLFILHRETGKPLFPIEERPVPPSDVPGEGAWPTQPFPTRPPPLVPEKLAAADAWGLTEADREACRRRLEGLRSQGMFTPPSLQGTVIFPGNLGGMNWSSVSVDPVRRLVVAPTNRLAMSVTLIPRQEFAAARRGRLAPEISPQSGTPFAMARDVLMVPNRLPCNPPPWGALTAVDLGTGAIRWEVPLGYFPGLENVSGHRAWGSLNLGGALLTRGGLVFIAGTFDQHLRVFDSETGKELWSGALPAAGNATPMTFTFKGRQYVVIAAGGHGRLGTKMGDYLVAFALPEVDATRHPPPAAPTWSRTYRGRLIGGRASYAAILVLRQGEEARVRGELETIDPVITGQVTGTVDRNQMEFEVNFSFLSRNCTGSLRGTAELANDGTLLVGEFRVSGPCSEGREEFGSLALRPVAKVPGSKDSSSP